MLARILNTKLQLDQIAGKVSPRQCASPVEVRLKDRRTLSRSTLDPHGTRADASSAEELIGMFRKRVRLSGSAKGLSEAIDIVRTLEIASGRRTDA